MPGVLPLGHRRKGTGISLDSLPDLERAIVLSRHKGRTVYVDSSAAAGGNGDSWPTAYTTLSAALLAAAVGDLILIAAGHTEAVTSTSIALTKADVTVVGLGLGSRRPTFTYGAAAATASVSGAGVSVINCHFVANFLSVAAAFTLAAAKDFRLDSCTFVDTSSVLDFLSIVVTSAVDFAADGLTVTNNLWLSLPASPNAFISILAALDRPYVENNYADMAATNDVGHFITIAAKVIRGAQILNNRLNVVGSAGAAVGVFMTGSSTTNTGIVAYNLVTSLDTTAALFITAAINLAVHENYMSGVVAASGTIYPAADNPA